MRCVLPLPSREAAGRALATALVPQCAGPDVLVLALPRGGVPVGFEIAQAMGAELDLLLVRKLGMPGDPELALGAIAAGGFRVLNPDLLALAGLDDAALARLEALEVAELERRALRYRGHRAPPVWRGRRVLLVDDGIATGATMQAAVAAARAGGPAQLWVAAPVASRHACAALAPEVDGLSRHPRALRRRRAVLRGFSPDSGRGRRRAAGPRVAGRAGQQPTRTGANRPHRSVMDVRSA